MTRAEERALEFYPMKDYNKEPNYIHSCDSKMLDEVYREVFMLGYEQAEKELGWNSVKDRLPEEGLFVFTCSEDEGHPQCVGFHYYKDGKWWEGYKEESVGAIDYWMEIPKLPKEEQK